MRVSINSVATVKANASASDVDILASADLKASPRARPGRWKRSSKELRVFAYSGRGSWERKQRQVIQRCHNHKETSVVEEEEGSHVLWRNSAPRARNRARSFVFRSE